MQSDPSANDESLDRVEETAIQIASPRFRQQHIGRCGQRQTMGGVIHLGVGQVPPLGYSRSLRRSHLKRCTLGYQTVDLTASECPSDHGHPAARPQQGFDTTHADSNRPFDSHHRKVR